MKAITEQWVKENKDKRFTFVFENGNTLTNIKLFVPTNGGAIGYLKGKAKRTGRYFPMYDTIQSITETTKQKKEYTAIGNAKTILNKIHANSWDELKQEMQDIINGGLPKESFDWHFTGQLKFRNISTLLNSHYKEKLIKAFKNKEEFSWHYRTSHHSGRDLTISTRVCEDGIFRAWFSSEFMGCGNGDYWLLLNPTTAIYYERD